MSTDGVEGRLAAIQIGQSQMVTLALDRLRASIEALLDGDFDTSADCAAQAMGKLVPLQQSQNTYMRLADGATVLQVPKVEVGMTVVGWGVVTAVEPVPPPDRGAPPAVRVTWLDPLGAEHSQTLPPDREVIAFPARPEPDEPTTPG